MTRPEPTLVLRCLLRDGCPAWPLPAAVARLVALWVARAAACAAPVVVVRVLSVTSVLHRLVMRLLLLVGVLLLTFKGSAARIRTLPRAQVERRFVVDAAARKPAPPVRLLLVHHRQLELRAGAAALIVIRRWPVLLRWPAERRARNVPTLQRVLLLVVKVAGLLGLRAVGHEADVAQVAMVRVLVATAQWALAHMGLR